MISLLTATLVGLLGLCSGVAGHGRVLRYQIAGQEYPCFEPDFQEQNPEPISAGWSVPEARYVGGVTPDFYQTPDIVCAKGATAGGTHTQIAAGSQITFIWNGFDRTHHGPVLTYLAKCPGLCENVNKEELEFFKIDEAGLFSTIPSNGEYLQVRGTWAADKLDDDNNSWTSTIPATVSKGMYVVRHERIALHNASGINGAQNYPSCINLEITGDGTDNPAGVRGEDLYKATDPGLLISIYEPHDNYTIPGPPLYTPGTSAPSDAVNPDQGSSASAYVASTTLPSSSDAAAPPPTSSDAPLDTATPTPTPPSTNPPEPPSQTTDSIASTPVYIETSTPTQTPSNGPTAYHSSPANSDYAASTDSTSGYGGARPSRYRHHRHGYHGSYYRRPYHST